MAPGRHFLRGGGQGADQRLDKNYFSILKAFGIRSRNPIPAETEYMNRWLKEYGFTMDLITEACTRTITQTGQPSFQYAEGILSSWKRAKVCTLEDVRRLDTEHRNSQKPLSPRGRPGHRRPAVLIIFISGNMTYRQLEKQLFEKQLAD